MGYGRKPMLEGVTVVALFFYSHLCRLFAVTHFFRGYLECETRRCHLVLSDENWVQAESRIMLPSLLGGRESRCPIY